MTYKIIFNSNTLFLSDDNSIANKCFTHHNYMNANKLKHFIFNDCIQFSNKEILIYAKEISVLWDIFKSFFSVRVAAGGLVVNTNKQLLFILRNGVWDLPKGHIEKGETIEQTALREVAEECGLQGLTITKPLPTTYHTYLLKNKIVLKQVHWFVMEYLGNSIGNPQTEEGITKIDWLNKTEQDKVFLNTYQSVKDIISYYYEVFDI